MVHPVMPFVTEEIWSYHPYRDGHLAVHAYPIPHLETIDPDVEAAEFDRAIGVTRQLRTWRDQWPRCRRKSSSGRPAAIRTCPNSSAGSVGSRWAWRTVTRWPPSPASASSPQMAWTWMRWQPACGPSRKRSRRDRQDREEARQRAVRRQRARRGRGRRAREARAPQGRAFRTGLRARRGGTVQHWMPRHI